MRAGACEMHVRVRVCVHGNPAGSPRGSDVQSTPESEGECERKRGEREREAAGSDRPTEGRRRNVEWKSVREGQLPVRFSRPWNGELDEERKGREPQEVEEVEAEEDDNGEEKLEGKGRE